MAKFCGNCGARLEDDAKVCGRCGTPVEGTPEDISGLNTFDPEKQRKTKKICKRVAILLAVLVAAAIAFNFVSQNTGYNGLVRKVMKACKNYDIDALVSLSGDIYFYGEGDEAEEYFETRIGNILDSLESSAGHNYKLSYEINEAYTLSGRRLYDLMERLKNDYPDFDSGIIKKVVVANLTISAKHGSRIAERDINIVMTKEKSSWKLLAIE